MTTSESLFDNNINNSSVKEIPHESSISTSSSSTSTTGPVISESQSITNSKDDNNNNNNITDDNNSDDFDDLDLGKTLITYRILVSRREAGAIIGKEGSNISKIRDDFDVKAGVSKVIDGCIDRILTITGMVDNIPDALVDIALSVTDANVQTIKECDENNTNPIRLISYEYPPLRPLTQRPNFRSNDYKSNLFLRLLIPNSQVGTLIGKGGSRIKAIQEDNNIKMVASKDFLDHSTERLVELQGTEENLKDAIKSISKYLLKDYQGTAPITFYVPCSPLENTRFNRNYNNRDNRDHRDNRNNYNNNFNNNTSNTNNITSTDRLSGKEIISKISFPNEYIGALIGKRGSRIQEIRLLSQCAVAIENENTDDDDREITLVGTKASVDKAIDLLNMYYEKEQKRRLNDE
ncbi:RNA binding protein, heterogenous nuclear RNP-K like protein [Pichia californica]|uniref:RNA binding protein, heterogenous nuclear RNP-K like protein n=1 Tax=Pichia californica TaxID=460514 RepID=A0A9P6WPM4_9ASCO|nr:RNA binding protein, heterogenous nuclear RNP-K like protein [[Candida] californica]KAG0690957.1 RNA binding protein, heterogenous nuclear RNP-K like protein [[Candida] californica]